MHVKQLNFNKFLKALGTKLLDLSTKVECIVYSQTVR